MIIPNQKTPMKTLLILSFAAVSNAVASYEIQWPAAGGGGGQSSGGGYGLTGRFGDASGLPATGGGYTLTSSPIEAAPPLPAENFAHWQHQHFTAEELADPAVSGPGQDPDGDQMVNELDFAVDGDPGGGDPALQLTLSLVPGPGGASPRITLGRNAAARGITLLVEGSDNQTLWTTLARSSNGEAPSGVAFVSETDGPFPLMFLEEPASLRRRFYRARVEFLSQTP